MRTVLISVGCLTHPDVRVEGRGDSVRAAIDDLQERARAARWAGSVRIEGAGHLYCPECARDLDSAPGRDG